MFWRSLEGGYGYGELRNRLKVTIFDVDVKSHVFSCFFDGAS